MACVTSILAIDRSNPWTLGPPVAGWSYDVLGIHTPFLTAAGLTTLAALGALAWRANAPTQVLGEA